MAREVIMPKLGQTMEEGTILEWYKRVGDRVRRSEPIFQLESDKAVLDSEAPGSGTLLKILYDVGETIPVLSVVALIGDPDEDVSGYVPGAAAPAKAEEAEQMKGVEAELSSAPQPKVLAGVQASSIATESHRIFASPRARKRALEESVDLSMVTGTGPNGRIKEGDVLAWLESRPRATPVARKMAAEAGLDLATIAGVQGRIRAEDVERAIAQAVEAQAAQKPSAAPLREADLVEEPLATTPLAGLRGIVPDDGRHGAALQRLDSDARHADALLL